jgi:hypothetical protein
MNKFAALTKEEIEASAVHEPADMPKETTGEIVMPIPPDAPPPPALHPKYGAHVAEWPYHDEQGRVNYIVRRYDPVGERKQFCPLTLWRDGKGSLKWRRKGPPVPRSLFNRDKLAANPDAPVVVTEGEKACEINAAMCGCECMGARWIPWLYEVLACNRKRPRGLGSGGK